MKLLRQYIRHLLIENYTDSLSKLDLTKDGVCMMVAEIVCKELLKSNITDFSIIEGFVWTEYGIDDDLYPTEHTWIEKSDGTKIDPSIIQFDKYGGVAEYIDEDASDADGEFYKSSARYTPEEYLNLLEKYPNNIKVWLKK